MVVIPPVVPRPHRPPSPQPIPIVEEKTKPGRKDDKKNAPPPPPEPEPELELMENGGGRRLLHALQWFAVQYI